MSAEKMPQLGGQSLVPELYVKEYPDIGSDPTEGPTIIDIKLLLDTMTDQELLDTVARWTDCDARLFDMPESPEGAALYERLNASLAQAYTYLTSELGATFISQAPRLKAKHDMVTLLRKVTYKGEIRDSGLTRRAGYCALLATGLAAWNALMHDVENLVAEALFLQDKLIDSEEYYNGVFLKKSGSSNGKKNGALVDDMFILKGRDAIRASIDVRGKSMTSFMTKFLVRPESSAKTAIKDGLGARITTTDKGIAECAEAMAVFLAEDGESDEITIECENIFTDDQFREFEERIRERLPETHVHQRASNDFSGGSFSSIKILGNVKIPEKGEEGGKSVNRRIEIQVVPSENKNEKKGMNHHLYEVVRKVGVMTRLFGSCEKRIFDAYISKAYQDMEHEYGKGRGMTEDNIRHYLLNADDRIVEGNNYPLKNSTRYISRAVYDRWLDIKYIDKNLYTKMVQPNRK